MTRLHLDLSVYRREITVFPIVTLCILCSVIAEETIIIYGSVIKPEKNINLEMNVTSYTVGCKLLSTGIGINSKYLGLYAQNTKIESRVINETTIMTEVDLVRSNHSVVCGVKTYTCKLNQTVLDVASITIGAPPITEEPSDFRCVSENREYLKCEFPQKDYCGMYTIYDLNLVKPFGNSQCDLESKHGKMYFDSRHDSCVYSAGHRNITFELDYRNNFGTKRSIFYVNHYDFIRPDAPRLFEISNISTNSVEVTWLLNVHLLNLDRLMEYEFVLLSEYGDQIRSFETMNFTANEKQNYSIQNLHSYANYILKMRVRVIPTAPRILEETYWSNWTSTTFRTLAGKPSRAPVTIPGAYSIKERKGDFATIEVYWQILPDYLHNGPEFGYNVSAVPRVGNRLNASTVGNGYAIFQHVKIDYYTVQISCFNLEGSAEEASEIQIFPPSQRPIIKQVLLDGVYKLSWFPAPDLELLSNYTIVYCNFTATELCRESISFTVLSPSATTFEVPADRVLNYGLSSNYRNYSSDLSWQQCVVQPDTGISYPKFDFTGVSTNSLVLQINISCTERSLVQRYEIRVRSKSDQTVMANITSEPYVCFIPIQGLTQNTEYEASVTAYDQLGIGHRTVHVVKTTKKGFLLYFLFYLFCGVMLITVLAIIVTQRVKKMMKIAVDIPLGLVGIDEEVENQNFNNEQMLTIGYVEKDDPVQIIKLKSEYDLPPNANLYEHNKNIYIQNNPHVETKKPVNDIQRLASDGYMLSSQMNTSSVIRTNNIPGNLLETSSNYIQLNRVMNSQ